MFYFHMPDSVKVKGKYPFDFIIDTQRDVSLPTEDRIVVDICQIVFDGFPEIYWVERVVKRGVFSVVDVESKFG